MVSSVVTFYSYKGGVGRSFALANIAVILAQWGGNVLVVDWDIEAPGLHHYFAPYAGQMPAGVLDFLTDCIHDKERPWSDYITPVELPGAAGRLQIVPAAASGADYTEDVQRLDWDALYREHNLGTRLEALRASWKSEFDLVLVDSRTGVTDFSGLTTAQLPDILAFMFTANNQSLRGCADIVRRAMAARRRMPIDRPALLPLPIPARFEQREEYDRAQEWRARFAFELKSFLDTWAPPNTDHLKLIDLLCIPYVPRWTFGEELAALLEPAGSSGTRTPNQAASYALETLAALLVHRFAKIDLLGSSRDEYVHAARSSLMKARRSAYQEPARIFLSYSQKDQGAVIVAQKIRQASGQASFFLGGEELAVETELGQTMQEKIEQADACIVIVGPSSLESTWQEKETEWILRQSLRSNQRRPIIPIVLKGGEKAFSSSRLADYNAVFLDDSSDIQRHLGTILARLDEHRSQSSLVIS